MKMSLAPIFLMFMISHLYIPDEFKKIILSLLWRFIPNTDFRAFHLFQIVHQLHQSLQETMLTDTLHLPLKQHHASFVQESRALWKARRDRAFTWDFLCKVFSFFWCLSFSDACLSSSVGLKKPIGNTFTNGGFSMAMLDYRRVFLIILPTSPPKLVQVQGPPVTAPSSALRSRLAALRGGFVNIIHSENGHRMWGELR